jgi:hypothetical protein
MAISITWQNVIFDQMPQVKVMCITGRFKEVRDTPGVQPDCYLTHFHLGSTLAQQGQTPRVIASYRNALRLYWQTRLGDWEGLIRRLSESLARHLSAVNERNWNNGCFISRTDG